MAPWLRSASEKSNTCSNRRFFFQAEDGIRDYKVTGVQTCALPICLYAARRILDKHQVAAVERGKGLLVGALDGGLHGRAQRLLHAGDQGQDAEVRRITGDRKSVV